jgi:RNA methyltransferase, TrmH family
MSSDSSKASQGGDRLYDDVMVEAGVEITSPANARVKQLVALRHRRARDRAGVTLVEGREELGLALSAGARPLTLYVCPDLAGGDAQPLIDQVADLGAEVVRVSRAVFGKIAYRESPDGWLAVLPQVPTGLDQLDPGPRPLILVCEGVEKPGNLGAILRTADAAGVAAVIAADPGTDWGNPNVVRASKGTVFSVPVASAPSAEVLAWIAGGGRPLRGGGSEARGRARHSAGAREAERSLRLVAAAPDGGTLLTDADLSGPTAIVVGSEAHGLPAAWLDRADVRVRIPMFGRTDSLNVATSAAILLYEAVRQRLASPAAAP